MLCYDPQVHGIATHAYVSTLLTSSGMQALIVVNPVNLQSTAFKNFLTIFFLLKQHLTVTLINKCYSIQVDYK